MKKFTTIILAVLLIMLMAVPAFAEEPAADAEVTATEASETTEDTTSDETPAEETPAEDATHFTFADGHITGSYESDGLVNIYVNDELAGGSTLNTPVEEGAEGTYVVKVYENGVLVHTETVQAGAQEPVVDPGTDETGTDQPGTDEPGQDQPTPGDDQKEDTKPAPTQPDNSSKDQGQKTTPQKATDVPKTGDAENMGTFMILGLGAALTLAAAKRVKSR